MKIFKIHKGQLLVTVFIALFISSCGAKKTITMNGAIIEKSDKQLIADIIGKELKYTTISGKTSFELTPANSKKSIKLNAVTKMIHDKAIQISFRIPILGGEAGRLTITPDSLLVIDRMNKKYVKEDVRKFASSQSAFNYYSLQAMLTNGLFFPGQPSVTKDLYDDFKVSVASNMYLLKTSDKSGLLYNFAVDGSDRIASTLIMSPKRDYTVQWTYSDFIEDGQFVYPTRMLGNMDIKKKRFDLKISYDKLDINKNVEIEMSIPSKYQQVTLEELAREYLGK